MEILNIITAVSRPENLLQIKDNIQREMQRFFNVTWYCVYDPGKDIQMVDFKEPWIISMKGGIPHDISGASQRNLALDIIKKGWNYFLDDDNIFHPGFGSIISQNIITNPDIQAFIFNQTRKTGNLQAAPENIKIGSIDVAQIIADKKLINKIRFFANVYVSDYYFIKRIYKRNKHKFVFIDQNLCYYNYLRR